MFNLNALSIAAAQERAADLRREAERERQLAALPTGARITAFPSRPGAARRRGWTLASFGAIARRAASASGLE